MFKIDGKENWAPHLFVYIVIILGWFGLILALVMGALYLFEGGFSR